MTVPARVRVTTDVDLRTVPFFGLHRYYGLFSMPGRNVLVTPGISQAGQQTVTASEIEGLCSHTHAPRLRLTIGMSATKTL